MCGIFGVVSTKPGPHNKRLEDFFTDAMVAGTVRGEDGAGIFTVDKYNNVEIFKRAVTGTELVQFSKWDKLNNLFKNIIQVGHNRKSTHGRDISSHCHPFNHSHITLVHNGVVTSYKKFDKDAVVDSEAICYGISEMGIDSVVKDLEGSFVLVWWDSNDETLNIVRNDQRPLWIASNKDEDYCIFTSEPGMMDWLAERNKIELLPPVEVAPLTLYSVGVDNKWSTRKLSVPDKKNTGNKWHNSTASGLLTKYNLLKHDEIIFKIVSFEPYNKNNVVGCAKGISYTEQGEVPCKLYQINKETITIGGLYSGPVSYVTNLNGVDEIIIDSTVKSPIKEIKLLQNEYGVEEEASRLVGKKCVVCETIIPPNKVEKADVIGGGLVCEGCNTIHYGSANWIGGYC